MTDNLLTKADVAEQLNISKSRVHNLIRNGELKAVHIGRSVRITVDEVEAFITLKLEETAKGFNLKVRRIGMDKED